MNKGLFLALSAAMLMLGGCGTAHSSTSADDGSLSKSAATRHEPVMGGYVTVSVDQPEVIDAAQFAVQTINERSNSLHPYTLVQILAAQSQVVAGTNYALTLQLDLDGVREIHDVIVFSQPWTRTMKLTKDVVRR